MAEDSGGANSGAGKIPKTEQTGGQPHIGITHQYVKDISFESPNAPQTLMGNREMPRIDVNVDVQARVAVEGQFEVSIRITADAKENDSSIFVVEVIYAGLFVLQNIPEDQVQAVCLIECPRILFPYARRVVSDLTRDGGFPPLLLDPIDFAELYRHHVAQQQEDQAKAGAPAQPAGGGDGSAPS